jgi:type IX secretion system PorP/SprF family membrane protein
MLRNIKINITIVLLLAFVFINQNDLKAQLAPLFSQSIRSQELLNPAYNADKDYVSAILIYRNQWYNINHSPNIMGVNVRFPLYYDPGRRFGGLGASVNILGETLGLRNTTVANLMLDAYIQIMEHTFLGVGITVGVEFFQYDLPRLQDLEDPVIIHNLTLNDILPNIGVGLLLVHNNYRFGISTLSTVRQNLETGKKSLIPGADIYLRAIYNLSKQVELMPAILIKSNYQFSPSIDVSSTITLNGRLSISAGHRISESIFAGCAIKLKDLFWLSYTYDYPIKGISVFGSASHEIGLSFGFNKSHYRGDRLNEFK